ncbi:AAA family ATPase [Halomonas sp. M20]|uniref:bifunctional aminoglycoside phosphotransferase/ATP-binding protein n=1 Tax=Halomonas sp. M20 TaxID=2763264 RepID=UPI001D0BBA0B|nr:bifunctional aminoglycoside phosphotransferase/ATP-binding protein [Halomonas sp. M20]
MSQALINALYDADCYDHPVASIEILETHISWIVLTGEFAYKLKKPLAFGSFLDFSSLDKRQHFCEQEVRLNRRLAPSLYLEAVPISGTPESPRVNDASAPFEYAVKMRQFSNRHLFSTLQASGELSLELLDDLIDQLVVFHEQAECVPQQSEFGTPASLTRILEREFALIAPCLEDEQDRQRLAFLHTWSQEALERLADEIQHRRQEGHVRETHGDVHLGNAVQHQGRALMFDGIEFNDELRWNDVGGDLAFLLMDLEARGEESFAHHALNRYLELSGDHGLTRLLPFYKFYRALVRAKVAILRYHQPELHPSDRPAIMASYRQYIELAARYAEFDFPYLLIGVGVSGSGKSRFTAEVVRRLGNVRLRSDVERKRLFGFEPEADTDKQDVDIYTAEATDRTYAQLARLTGVLLEAGRPVCIDATCLKREQRELLRHQAEGRGLPVLLISFEADKATLERRIEKRARRGGDPSEAGQAVLERQLTEFEPFGDDERRHLIHLDTTAKDANLRLVELIQEHLRLE